MSVSDEKGARLLTEGYRSVPAPRESGPAAPADKPKAAKPRAKKAADSADEE